jgi:hypothetical protein
MSDMNAEFAGNSDSVWQALCEERSQGMRGDVVKCGVCEAQAEWHRWDNGQIYYCTNCGSYLDKDGDVIAYHE